MHSAGKNLPGRTHYTKLHIKLFFKQALRLKTLLGFHAKQVTTAQELLAALEDETKNYGQITSVAIFCHGGISGEAGGLFLKSGEGFYTNNVDVSSKKPGFAKINDLANKINNGNIKFAPNATIFIDACNAVYTDASKNNAIATDNSIAYNLCLETGVSVVACSGHMEQQTPGVSNGKFTSKDGEFYKLTRVEEEYEEEGVIKKKFVIKTQRLGKDIKVDDHAK